MGTKYLNPPAGRRLADQQRLVNDRFQSRARRWEDLYGRADLFSVIHQDRHARAVRWIDGLGLARGTRVLEVGPGAGLMTVALTQRDFMVAAADTVPAMIDLARRRAVDAGTANSAGLVLADANRLAFSDASFALVVALGVIPWMTSAAAAIAEMARVLAPGGYLVVNADNKHRLNAVLDPRHLPALDPMRLSVKSALRAVGIRRSGASRAVVTAHRLAEFDRILGAAGLERVSGCTFGFGPFTLFGAPVLPQRLGVQLNNGIQRLADRGAPALRQAGNQYLVLARRAALEHCGPRPAGESHSAGKQDSRSKA